MDLRPEAEKIKMLVIQLPAHQWIDHSYPMGRILGIIFQWRLEYSLGIYNHFEVGALVTD